MNETRTNGDGEVKVANEAPRQHPERIAGRYRICRMIGSGGFGAVFEAHDEIADRTVALKVIREQPAHEVSPNSSRNTSTNSNLSTRSRFTRDSHRPRTRRFSSRSGDAADRATEQFKDEFRLLTHLHHPNLAKVIDFGACGEIDGSFFTQELVQGPHLVDFMVDAPREVIVDLFLQLARALDYIHALGLIHEDIKPSNVMVAQVAGRPQAKLIDFGLARMLSGNRILESDDESEGSELTILGTPGYCAPEKIQGRSTDHRSDIYALAATMYSAVLGVKPFAKRDFREALKLQLDWTPELAGVLVERCGSVVAEIIGRMLHPDPENRPQSARAIVLELIRRESQQLPDRNESRVDRAQFARVLVEHLPFEDRAGYLDILLTRASEILVDGPSEDTARTPVSIAETSASGLRMHKIIRTIIVESPEGMGKQRLMSELRREVQLGGGLFVEGNYWNHERSALGPFASVVMQIATALGEHSPLIEEFSSLIRLARRESVDQSAASSVIEFLIRVSAERPFVLHLSDLVRGREHLGRFEQLVHAIDHNSANILLCATTIPHARITSLLKMLSREQLGELWHLRPFAVKEMNALLKSTLGVDGSTLQNLTIMLDKLTGGHPLSFRETLRVLIEEQILVRDGVGWVLRDTSSAAEELQKTLSERAESRLNNLGVSAWEIASVLYLLDAPIAKDQLFDLTDLRRDRYERTLDRLAGEGLISRWVDASGHMISLAHESVRQAVVDRYSESLDETRIELTVRIEELNLLDPNFTFVRAQLLDQASTGLDVVPALESAARQLFDNQQPRLGAQVLARLISRLRRYGGAKSMRKILDSTLFLLREGQGTLDDVREETAMLEAGVLIAELLQDFRAQALLWLGLSDRLSLQSNEIHTILERLERAAETAKIANEPMLEFRIASRRAEALIAVGDIEQAGMFSRKSMGILNAEYPNDSHVCHIIGVRLRCLSLSGQLGEARKLHDSGKSIAKNVPVAKRSSYLSGIAFLAVLSGDPERAIPEMEEAVTQLRAANLHRMLLNPLHNLGDLSLRAGDYDRAVEVFDEARRLSTLYGNEDDLFINTGFLGYTRARMGDPEGGAELLSVAREGLAQSPAFHVSLQQIRLLDAEVAHMLKQSARARRELEEMLDDFHLSNEIALCQWAQDALARIEQDLGQGFVRPIDLPTNPDACPDQETVRTAVVKR
ncbi:MAG: protein kinase domain-containing protein [Nannocystaceae bacterium]